ncbi:MAG: DUF3578 domain-containing protein [Peptostreptococcus sp.]|uniref:MrcB family domain-containing protein n=1 Tax=Peptostreptococcus sp. TaxID=1262 RepID=UPI002FCC3A77
MSEKTLTELIQEAGNLYKSEEREEFKGSNIGTIITKKIPSRLKKLLGISEDKYIIEGSIGKGQYAEIPWVAIFNKEITESATRGIYIVYLYTADMTGVYLSLNQGYTYFSDKFTTKKAKEEIKNMANSLSNMIESYSKRNHSNIYLNASNKLGKGYMAGHITGKDYDLNELPDESVLVEDLLELIEVYEEINKKINTRTIEEFYDFIIAEKKGLLDTENIIDSTFQVKENEEGYLEYTSKDKKEPVIDQCGKKLYLRDPNEAAKALKRAGYKCEVDESHNTFINKSTALTYMEAHHLIPISKGDLFDYSVDNISNICCLCPNCHRKIHFSKDEDRIKMIELLYDKRKVKLEKTGLALSLEDLLGFYDIKKLW